MRYLLLVLAVVASSSFASIESGVISNVLVRATNVDMVHIIVDGVNNDKPECAVNVWEYVIDISTETGKAMYSLALALHLSEKPVTVYGTGACSLFAESETVNYISS